jgi:hypothetical protein
VSAPATPAPELRLTAVSFTTVEFELARTTESGELVRRPVVVRVGTGSSWVACARFPTMGSSASASTGDEALDRTIRERAAEELVRLEAAVHAMGESDVA